MQIWGPLHAEVLLTLLTHVHPSFCWEAGTELIPAREARATQLQMRNLKKWCQSPILLWDTPLFALIFNNVVSQTSLCFRITWDLVNPARWTPALENLILEVGVRPEN